MSLPEGEAYVQFSCRVLRWAPMLSDVELRVMLALVDAIYHLDNGGRDFVRLFNSDLVEKTKASASACRAAVHGLYERGAIDYRQGKTNRKPNAYKINLGWVPTPPRKRQVEEINPSTKTTGQDNSHLNHTVETTGSTSSTPPPKREVTPPRKRQVQPLSKTPEIDSPLPSGDPQGGRPKGEKVGDHPATLEACVLWHLDKGFTREQAEEFFYAKEAIGWRQGRGGTLIKSWTAAAQYWHRPKDWQQPPRGSPARNGNGAHLADGGGRTLEEMRDETLGWLTGQKGGDAIDITPRADGE